jgi:S-adenosylmethionine decarboxylase proenzyme
MHGLHLIADLHACTATALFTRTEDLARLCEQAAIDAGLTVVGRHWHGFGDGQGVTGVVLLAESHIALHTWPELAAATLDVYVCNFSGDNTQRAESVVAAISAAFAPGRSQIRRVERGELAGTAR